MLARIDDVLGASTGTRGYAVELGAADGLYMSTTLYLERVGWEVLCIEANPFYERALRARRAHGIIAACGSENRPAVELEVFARGMQHPVASTNLTPEFRTRFCPDLAGRAPTVVRVPLRTLDNCIEEVGFPRVDFLSLDVDGAELDILRGFDLVRWNPKLVMVENTFNDADIHAMFPDSYERTLYDEYNEFYVRKGIA